MVFDACFSGWLLGSAHEHAELLDPALAGLTRLSHPVLMPREGLIVVLHPGRIAVQAAQRNPLLGERIRKPVDFSIAPL